MGERMSKNWTNEQHDLANELLESADTEHDPELLHGQLKEMKRLHSEALDRIDSLPECSDRHAKAWAEERAETTRPLLVEALRELSRLATECSVELEKENWSAINQASRLDRMNELLSGIGPSAGLLAVLEHDLLEGSEEGENG